MDLKKLLEYQALDMEFRNIKEEFDNSEEMRLYNEYTDRVNSSKEEINKINTEASKVSGSYASISARLKAVQENLDQFDGIVDDVLDVKEADYYLKKLGELQEEIAALEKQAITLAARLSALNEKYENAMKAGRKYVEAKRQQKPIVEKMNAQLLPRRNALMEKMQKVAEAIPADIMRIYKVAASSPKTKFPVVVPYDAQNNRCSSCRIVLENATRAKLKNPGDCAECPKCGRILYVQTE